MGNGSRITKKKVRNNRESESAKEEKKRRKREGNMGQRSPSLYQVNTGGKYKGLIDGPQGERRVTKQKWTPLRQSEKRGDGSSPGYTTSVGSPRAEQGGMG